MGVVSGMFQTGDTGWGTLIMGHYTMTQYSLPLSDDAICILCYAVKLTFSHFVAALCTRCSDRNCQKSLVKIDDFEAKVFEIFEFFHILEERENQTFNSLMIN